MTIFESTDESFRNHRRSQAVLGLQIGRVTRVFEHTDANDKSNFEVNMTLRDENKERRRVPILQPFDGAIDVPEEDDMVIAGFIDGHGERPLVIGTLYNDIDRAPLGEAGVHRKRKGNVYVEMHPDGDWARLAYRNNETADNEKPQSRVEITNTGEVIIDEREPVTLSQSEQLSDGGASAYNYNTAEWTVVPWDTRVDEQDVDDPLTHGGDTYLQADVAGTYHISVKVLLYAATSGQYAISLRGTLNNEPLAALTEAGDGVDTSVEQTRGAITTGGFISNDANHVHSSLEMEFDVEMAEGDQFRLESKAAAATGDVYPVEQHSVLTASLEDYQ